jgi:hypothetical protein
MSSRDLFWLHIIWQQITTTIGFDTMSKYFASLISHLEFETYSRYMFVFFLLARWDNRMVVIFVICFELGIVLHISSSHLLYNMVSHCARHVPMHMFEMSQGIIML